MSFEQVCCLMGTDRPPIIGRRGGAKLIARGHQPPGVICFQTVHELMNAGRSSLWLTIPATVFVIDFAIVGVGVVARRVLTNDRRLFPPAPIGWGEWFIVGLLESIGLTAFVVGAALLTVRQQDTGVGHIAGGVVLVGAAFVLRRDYKVTRRAFVLWRRHASFPATQREAGAMASRRS